MTKINATLLLSSVAAFGMLCTSSASALDLIPRYQPRPETDSERLQNFKPPPPPPPSYPSIRGAESGDPRLYINKDVSLGGNVKKDGAEGNVRFPIPGRK